MIFCFFQTFVWLKLKIKCFIYFNTVYLHRLSFLYIPYMGLTQLRPRVVSKCPYGDDQYDDDVQWVSVQVSWWWCPVGQCPSVSALPTVPQSSVAAAFSQTLSYWPLHHMWSVRPSHRPLSHTSQQLSQVERESFLQSRNIEIQRDGGESI